VVYGRTGSCLGRFGTLVAFLIDVLTLVTGSLDREGGAIFGAAPLRIDEIVRLSGLATYGRGCPYGSTRVDGSLQKSMTFILTY
jgi:hypothetical protein